MEMTASVLRRREALKLAVGVAGAAMLAACGGAETATNTPGAATSGAVQASPTAVLAGGTGGQTPAPAGTLTGGAGGQATAAATAAPVGGSAATQMPAQTAMPAATPGTAMSTMPTMPMTPVTAPVAAAGTTTPNTAVKGAVRYWQVVYDDVTVPSAKFHDQWIASLKTGFPNVTFTEEQYALNDLLDKIRVAFPAGQAPDMAEIQLTWAPDLAASGMLQEINLADFGYTQDKFWPGALRGSLWQGKLYGIPKRNETMAFIYNRDIFEKAGLDPTHGPDTWEDVKTFSKQIRERTGKAGFGLCAKSNNSNTPYRYMPVTWAYGGGALDETADAPKYEKSLFDTDANIAALQWMTDMFTSGYAPQSSLTNTQTEVRNLFVSGEIAMMIDKPDAYPIIKNKSPDAAEKMVYALMPRGPVRRAVVFGGWNAVLFKGAKNPDAAKALIGNMTSPLWSLRLSYEASNPGNRDAFLLPEQQQRLKEIKFLDIATEMMQYGISFPAIPEAADIMNLMVPQMVQDAMTKTKTPEQSAKDTAKKVNDLLAKRK